MTDEIVEAEVTEASPEMVAAEGPHVVLYGPRTGFKIVGPFDGFMAAWEWIDDDGGCEYEIVKLEQPA